MSVVTSAKYTIDNVNTLDRETFVDVFGNLFENSPWVAEQAWLKIPYDSAPALLQTMSDIVLKAGRQKQHHLLNLHPELGTKQVLTQASESEQASAGLMQNTASQIHDLADLNKRYREKFGFPFIIAVKDLSPDTIITHMLRRLSNEQEVEFRECLQQVFNIVRFRLDDILD